MRLLPAGPRLRARPGAEAGRWSGWLAAGLLAVLAGCPGPDADREPGSRPPAPGFDLPALDGGRVSLAQLRGRVVIVDFWATWCAPCEVQMPVLDALWREAGGEDLAIVGVSVDTRPASEVEAWVEDRGLDYPIVLGDQDLAMRYGVIGFPTLVVIDPMGRIYRRHTGVLSRPELEELLTELHSEANREPATRPSSETAPETKTQGSPAASGSTGAGERS